MVECAVYYGGRRVSPLEATGLETLRDESGNYLWDNTVNLGMQIPTVPREARICFAVKVVDDSGKRTPLAWTSCGVFDHAGRLIAGPHSLPLLPGEPNPIGICVHAMGLQTNSQLKVVFQKDSSPTVPIVHFTCTPPDFTIATSAGNISSSSSSSSKTKAKISEVDKARLDELVGKDPLYVLSDEERTFVWKHRDYLRWVPLAIIKIAQSVPWVIPAAVQAMHGLLKEWPLIAPVRALELLDGKYPDGRLRAYAVRCLEQMGVDELDDYLMQLVQALKCETYHNSPLALFMLRKAVNHRLPLGHTLFLLLKAEMHIPEVRERFTLFLKCYLRASGQHRDVIIRQLDLIDALVAANRVKSFQALENFAFCGHFYLPHDPTLCVSRLIPEKCRVLGSARAPLWLAFENADKLSKEPVCVLFKAADDLRQDMLALQVIKLMGRFWEGDGLDMRLTVYKCVALGPAVGMIEVVPDCTTIADIQKLMGGGVTSAFKEKTIAEWLRKKNPSRAATATATAAGTLNDTVVSNFAHSLAGYCVATYLVGVGDRHNDNIMLKSDGRLFHIDFGHILGNVEKWNGIKRDRAPFVLTPEFVYVMGGKRSDGFAKFCDVACVAYNVIRKYSSTFITLFTMMLSTDIPELRSEEDIYYLKSAFNTEMDDEAAKECFRDLIMQSLGTKMTRINNAIHIAVHPHINDAHDANMD